MTIDELYNDATQETGLSAGKLQRETSYRKDLTLDDWRDYWSANGCAHLFEVVFHPVINFGDTYSTTMMNSFYPPEKISILVERYILMIDIVTSVHSDIRVEKDFVNGELKLDVMFMPGNKHDVIHFLIRMWKLFGAFSRDNFNHQVRYYSMTCPGDDAIVLNILRNVCATLYSIRKNEPDRSVKNRLDEKDFELIISTLKQTGFFSSETTFEDISRIVFEFIRKSLNLRDDKIKLLPEWTSTQVTEIMNYKALCAK